MTDTVVHGRYSILRTLGGGGMARVYLAHDEILGRDVAIKVLRDQYAEDAEFVERFKREARSAASLSHPNIVAVYDRGVAEDGTSYIAMEHVPGGSLKERISQKEALNTDAAIGVALQISYALEEAHGRGVIHRDIKPHNVLLTAAGDVKVADFGIARAAAYTSISQTSLVLGTASYMSPEQALGEPADPRSDLYSLGVVLYEMLTGELPYTADNPVAISMKHVNDPLRPPREVNPDIPEDLDAIVSKLLSKKSEDRYAGATELAEDLRRVRDGLPPLAIAPFAVAPPAAAPVDAGPHPTRAETRQAVPPPPPAPARRRRRRSTPRRLAVILLLLAVLGGLAWAVSQNSIDGGDSGNGGNDRNNAINRVEVPSVEGLTQDAAQQRLEAAGLRVQAQQRESTPEETGVVLGQSPNGGRQAEEGSVVTLAVGSGPVLVSVPEVRDMGRADAEAALARANLAVGNVREIQSSDLAPGIVIEQGYEPGAEVQPETAVNLGVSVEPPPSSAPETPDQNTPSPAQPAQPDPVQPQEPQQEPPPQELPPQQPSQDPPQQQEQPSQDPPQQDLNEEIQEQVDERLEDAGILDRENNQNGNNGGEQEED